MSDNLRYTKEHEWVRIEDGSDVVTIGITDFAAGELGDIVFIELPDNGTEVKAMESIGTIEAVKTVADLYAPLTGVIEATNDKLADDPALVNQSPFDDGWFLKMVVADRAELDGLMDEAQYKDMIG